MPPLGADRRRALELLADSGDGCTVAIMMAHGFTLESIVNLVGARLATAKVDQMIVGGRPVDVVRIGITESGRVALEGSH